MSTFEAALVAENERFLKQSYAEVLKSDGPFEIFGLMTGNDDKKSRVEGQLYQTKAKRVLIAVFVGILSREDHKFGRVVMFSSGVPGSTVKIEFPDDNPEMMESVSVVADSDETGANAREYYNDFIRNIVYELKFNEGVVVPNLEGRSICAGVPEDILVAQKRFADDSQQQQQQPEQKRQKTEGDVDAEECMVCMDARPQTLVLPCMHRVVCEACSETLKGSTDSKTCIYCRCEIKGVSCESGDFYFPT